MDVIKHLEYLPGTYEALKDLGVLCTEEYTIRTSRESYRDSIYERFGLSFEDIDGVGYADPHFRLPTKDLNKRELWIEFTYEDGTISYRYLNPHYIRFIEVEPFTYCLVDMKELDDFIVNRENWSEFVNIRSFINMNVIYREHFCGTESRQYRKRIDTRDMPYSTMLDPTHCAFYISRDTTYKPNAVWLDSNVIEFQVDGVPEIDFYLSTNLVGVYNVTAGIGAHIDNLYSKHCYYHMVVDHEHTYPINSTFYPCITVDKTCVVRVYDDVSQYMPRPEVTRLMAYPEFINVADPYNTDIDYLNKLKPCNDVINEYDTDEVILKKFINISAYCYRMWERFPIYSDEIKDFLVCDNKDPFDPTFFVTQVHLVDEVVTKIVSKVPCEPYRDILFYNGMIFNDYIVKNISKSSGMIVENNITGKPCYLIDTKYNPQAFTVIKFNTAEDTIITNAGDYIDTSNFMRLHESLNKFYRNLLILRSSIMDNYVAETVRISTVEPTIHDDHLWFELLMNVTPEDFQTKAIDAINFYGLDPKTLPQPIKDAMYMVTTGDGTDLVAYRDLLMTYFKLHKSQKQYLAIRYGDADDPEVNVYREINIGTKEEFKTNNALVINDPAVKSTENDYWSGPNATPDYPNPQSGDLYVKAGATQDKTPLKITASRHAPDDSVDGDLHLNMRAIPNSASAIPNDVVSKEIVEVGKARPAGYDDGISATVAIELHPHSTSDEMPELTRKVEDETLYPIYYGEDAPTDEGAHIWYEFIDEIDGQVCYSDDETMVVRVDERLYWLEFKHNNVETYAFDDIFLNFNGGLKVKYMTILADLINSNVISLNDVSVFYKRLITKKDVLDPGLERMVLNNTYVVSTADVDGLDYFVQYSSNIGRFRMDYSDMSNDEQGATYRNVIDYTTRDFAFLADKMMLFVNGKYVNRSKYRELFAFKIELIDFDEIISTVDILYSKKEYSLMLLKRCAYNYWQTADRSISLDPTTRKVMDPIVVGNKTSRGYYEILLQDYILNDHLARDLKYYESHPNEFAAYKDELVRKFHAVSDIDAAGIIDNTARMLISGTSTDPKYIIG